MMDTQTSVLYEMEIDSEEGKQENISTQTAGNYLKIYRQ